MSSFFFASSTFCVTGVSSASSSIPKSERSTDSVSIVLSEGAVKSSREISSVALSSEVAGSDTSSKLISSEGSE